MTDKKAILRKYFHGLTDEQFAEDISRYPLANVLRAMDDYALQIAQEAVREEVKDENGENHMIVKNVGFRIMNRFEHKLKEE